jgi:hypothetical protein
LRAPYHAISRCAEDLFAHAGVPMWGEDDEVDVSQVREFYYLVFGNAIDDMKS